MNTQSVLITLAQAAVVHISRQSGSVVLNRWLAAQQGETSLSEMTQDGSPPPPGPNIPGGESRMSWWMVEIGHSAIWTWFHGMINLSGGPWLSVIWNPLSMYLLHNTSYLLQLNLPFFGPVLCLNATVISHLQYGGGRWQQHACDKTSFTQLFLKYDVINYLNWKLSP